MILITGITGLTGRFLLEIFMQNGYKDKIKCLVRQTSDYQWLINQDISICFGDVNDEKSLINALDNVDKVIHLVNIRSAPQIIGACKKKNVDRVIIVSTTGIYSKYNQYSQKYKELEHFIKNSGVNYTIIRPTMIYGNIRDKNVHKLVKIANKLPVFPLIGDGNNLFQPIYARDLADFIFKVATNDVSIRKEYDVSGKEPIKYIDMIKEIYKNLNKTPRFIKIPFFIATLIGKICDHIPWIFIDSEKINRLREDKNYGHELASIELNFNPISFQEGIRYEIESLKKEGVI